MTSVRSHNTDYHDDPTGPDGMHIPKAPALGLLLEQPRFGSYNDRVDSLRSQKSQAQHLPVRWAFFYVFTNATFPVLWD
jgi:tRNA U38,U39,U40 pseudouridine synthase TruA